MPNEVSPSDKEMLDWVEEHQPQIAKYRESECRGDFIELGTKNGTWRGKTLRSAIRSAIRTPERKL